MLPLRALEVRPGDARGAAVERQRSRAARRALQGENAPEDPAAARSSPKPLQIEHYGWWSPNLLAHIDTLDAALQNLTERIEVVLASHAKIVELLCTVPGVQAHAAQVLIAECSLDMTRFPTVGHVASWAGTCPGHHESAGRRGSGRTRPVTESATKVTGTDGLRRPASFVCQRTSAGRAHPSPGGGGMPIENRRQHQPIARRGGGEQAFPLD
jgi:transposase